MTKRYPMPSLRNLVTGCAVTGLVMVALLVSTSSETVLRNSFQKALHGFDTTSQQVAKLAPLAGSEDYWLSAIRQDGGAPVTKTVAVGDRISMSLGGELSNFEVSAVAEFAPGVIDVDTGKTPSHFVLVTARDTLKGSKKPIRFVMEIEGGSANVAGKARPRTL